MLSKLYAVDGPFVSVYLETVSDVENAAPRLETAWKNTLRTLEQAGVDEATREALTAARGDHARGATRVLIAAHGSVHVAISLPQPPVSEGVVVGPLPRLVPLLDALGVQVPHVVVLADRTGADVLAHAAGPDPVEAATVSNDRFPNRKVHAGGWAAKRYSNDVEETWEQSAHEVAGLVDRVARDIGARVVIASGDERALQLVGQQLPSRLADRFVEVAGGGRHVDGSEEVIAGEVLRVLGDTVSSDTMELLEDFAQQRGRAERACDGVDATVEALRMSRVGTLILGDTRDVSRFAWFGPDPTHLARTERELADLGVDRPQRAPLEEVLVRAALGTAADIRFVSGSGPQAPSEGVGGLLR